MLADAAAQPVHLHVQQMLHHHQQRRSTPCNASPTSWLNCCTVVYFCPFAVHFIGRCLPSGDVFLNSKEDSQAAEPYIVVAGRGAQQQARVVTDLCVLRFALWLI